MALPLVLAVVLGSIELGMFGNANLNVGAAVPEAAREASIARAANDADLQILAVLRSRIGPRDVASVKRIVVYAPASLGASPSAACRTGASDGTCTIYTSLSATAAATPPACTNSTGHCPAERLPGTLLGIEVTYEYRARTRMIAAATTLVRRSVVRIEPAT